MTRLTRISRCLLIALVAFTVTSPVFANEVDPKPLPPLPDRSFLWKSEEAFGHVLPWELYRPDEGAAYGYDVDHYDLDMTFDFGAQTIDAVATMTATVTEANFSPILVDLIDALDVTEVTVDGTPRFYTRVNDQISIVMLEPPTMGAQIDIAISYNGAASTVGSGGNRKGMRWGTHGGEDFVFTLSTPFSTAALTIIPVSHHWRPCKDVPDDKSTYSGSFTVPDNMRACSNGVQTGEVDNGDGTKTFSWAHGYPVAPYLITVAATNYVTIDDTYVGTGGSAAIQQFVWPEDLADATESLNIAVESIGALAARFGEYPFIGEKYGVFQTDGGPAVEEQTMVAYPSNLINGVHTWDWIYVHELAHMWWGDNVTCQSWDHVWLSEGFASYGEALWFEHLGGSTALHDYMENMDTGPYAGTIVGPPYVWNSIVYDKGAWVLHMLRRVMGETDFFQMLLDYRAAHENGNVVSDDLIAVAEAVYGGDLNWYFDQWLQFEGRPEYTYEWTEGSTTLAPTVELTIDQVQSMSFPTYEMPIDVVVTTASGTEIFTIDNSMRTQSYSLPTTEPPLAVALDPDNWILGDFTEIIVGVDEPGVTPAAFLATGRPNPMHAQTTIRFGTSREGKVALRVFDGAGRMVRALVRDRLPAGEHEIVWDGRTDEGRLVASGAYFVRLVNSDGVMEQRLILIR